MAHRQPKPSWLDLIDAQHRLLVAIATAILAGFCFRHPFTVAHLLAEWNVFALVYLFLAGVTVLTGNPKAVHENARLQDSGRILIFLLVIAAACISLFTVVYVLHEHHTVSEKTALQHLANSVVAIIASWFLIHTLFCMHYAHIFYRDIGDKDVEGSGGGLDFPGKHEPDYLDFAYFSFVVGMTCQVSDVQITSRTLRRLTLLHGILSFAFNTLILALSINIISGLFVR